VWRGTAGGFILPAVVWDGGPNSWKTAQSRFVTGDFDGDGVSDIGGFYDYGGARTRLWMWRGAASGLISGTEKWDSGPNSWAMTSTHFL
jgi:hypothetical protein